MNGNHRGAGKKAEAARLVYVHPIWYSFVKYCEALEYGEIEKLKIQDGLPVAADRVLKKTKFC